MDPVGLRRLAGRWKIPLGIVEKDHVITVALGVLASLPCAGKMAFKGGTALRKAYFREYRFSEDLDFTAMSDVASDVVKSKEDMVDAGERSGIRFRDLRTVRAPRSSRKLAIRYDDMNGHPNHIRLELSLREKVLLPVELRPIHDPYGVLEGQSRVPTMALPEILAEKVRAMYMRTQARDLYDLWTLLREGVRVIPQVVEAKLAWWRKGMGFDPRVIVDRIPRLEATWVRDLDPLLATVPPFAKVVRDVRAGVGFGS